MNPHVGPDVDLDAWTRHVLDVHFDPDDGTPFWLDWAEEHDVDPRDTVESFDDLERVFDSFDEDVLRNLPVAQFHPRSLDGDRRVYETGGTTGAPKRVVMVDYWREQARWADGVLDDDFPRGNVLMLGPPGGANNAGVFVQHLAHAWDALPFHVTMDPRWAKHLAEHDQHGFDEYVEHLVDQAERVLESQDVTVLFTTSRLLERARVRDLVAESGVEAVYHGGTALDRDTHRVFHEDWYADVAIAGEYGNTLMGVAQEVPTRLQSPAERDYHLDYVPCRPYFVPEVVDSHGEESDGNADEGAVRGDGVDGSRDIVDYGERGTVRLTVLTEEFFVPLLGERDEATRIPGDEPYDWDWLRDPATATDRRGEATEGVY